MKVGDLVILNDSSEGHTDGDLGLVTKINTSLEPIDQMFPYFICFDNSDFNDWYPLDVLELLSEPGS
jgi:hypothetical protein